MSIENINFRALSPFGIEANEISITEINGKDLVFLRNVIANHCFIVFQKQAVSGSDFVAFLIWDNRCTMHRADHSNVVGDRVLHRGLVLGEAVV
jgi:hypothetical protein